ncbi:hypothetical protein HanRHA438_Chr04g0152191 [Helianthus annuus]|nr:hypothetical protein HanRHA438_Chr04g0152191 [Helianthus annuus]
MHMYLKTYCSEACTSCLINVLSSTCFSNKGVRGAHLIGESPILHLTNHMVPRQLT